MLAWMLDNCCWFSASWWIAAVFELGSSTAMDRLQPGLAANLASMYFWDSDLDGVQVAFVDPPKLDFDLRLPSDSHGSGLLDYVSNWADAFICDKVLSQYVLPDHYFSQVDGVSTTCCCRASAVQGKQTDCDWCPSNTAQWGPRCVCAPCCTGRCIGDACQLKLCRHDRIVCMDIVWSLFWDLLWNAAYACPGSSLGVLAQKQIFWQICLMLWPI